MADFGVVAGSRSGGMAGVVRIDSSTPVRAGSGTSTSSVRTGQAALGMTGVG